MCAPRWSDEQTYMGPMWIFDIGPTKSTSVDNILPTWAQRIQAIWVDSFSINDFWLTRNLILCSVHVAICLEIENRIEALHDKTNKMTCAPSEDSDQPGHPPSLIRVSAVRIKKAWVLSYPLSAQRRPWSDWADAQADLSLRWAHSHIVGFVTRRLRYSTFIFTLFLWLTRPGTNVRTTLNFPDRT